MCMEMLQLLAKHCDSKPAILMSVLNFCKNFKDKVLKLSKNLKIGALKIFSKMLW